MYVHLALIRRAKVSLKMNKQALYYPEKIRRMNYTYDVNDVKYEKGSNSSLDVPYINKSQNSTSNNNDDAESVYYGTFDNYADIALTYFNDMQGCEGWDMTQCQHLLAVDWEQTGRRLIAGGILKLKHFGDSYLHVYYL
jgi:hypothetical protein